MAGAPSMKASRSSSQITPRRARPRFCAALPLGRPAQQREGHARQVQPADRSGVAALGRSHRPFKETPRSGAGESADRPHPAAEPARRRPLHSGAGAGFRLHVACNASFDEWAALSEGAYLLCSNIGDWSDQQLWKAYIQLTQAEAAFRIQKDQLNVRPIWHQHAERVQAHILVCFLAFVLWKSLEMWQQRAGLGNSPRTVLEELARIQSHDVVLPTASHGQIRLRCVTQPDAAQAALLDRLGIVLPKRMRLEESQRPALAISA